MPGAILIAGGSGLLGTALAQFFAARGNPVIILSRHPGPDTAPNPRSVAWTGIPADRPAAWETHLAGAAALINLAGRSVNCRYHAANRRRIMDSRILSTRALARALVRCPNPPPVWLNSSTATIYQHTLGPAHDETGAIGPTPEARDAFSLEVATAWEREFFSPDLPLRRVAMRTAIVFSRRAGSVFPIVRRLTRLGLGGKMGDGRQWVSWIHELDFCRAVEFLIARADLSGHVNLAAPHPLTNAEMMATFRQVFRRPLGLPAARWMLEIGAFFLRTETELLLKSRRVISTRLPAAGFQFLHPDFAQAPRHLAGGSCEGSDEAPTLTPASPAH